MAQTVTTQKSQNETNSAKANAAFSKAIKQLRECHGLVVRGEQSKIKAVQIVKDFIKTVKHGDRNAVRDALLKNAGIGRATFFRWQSEVEEDAQIGSDVIQEANRQALTITTPVRKALLEVKAKDPKASPAQIVKEARELIEAHRPPAPIQPAEKLRLAVAEFLDGNNNVSELLATIRQMNIPKEAICAALEGMCN